MTLNDSGESVCQLVPPRSKSLDERGYEVLCVHRSPQIFSEHQHPELQIIIPFQGARMQASWQSETGGRAAGQVTDAEIVVVPSNQPHELNWQAAAAMGMFWLTINFLERATDGAYKSETSRIIESYGARDNLVRELGSALYSGWLESTVPNLYTESLANVLAVRLTRHYAVDAKTVAPPARGGLTAYQIGRVTDYTEAHLSEDLTLFELGRELNLSSYHFARQFKVAMGKTPYQWVTELRLERAKFLLKSSQLPILDVCYSCGFQTQSYFTTVFRRYTGTTPKVYRETRG